MGWRFLSGRDVGATAPGETFTADVSLTMAWIDRALNGLDPLTIEPQQ